MTSEVILREINSLPTQAQRQVEGFVAVLRERYKDAHPTNDPTPALETEAFVGMWRDCEDMGDSSAWVRNIRALP